MSAPTINQPAQRRDPLETLAQGLNIAHSVYGIMGAQDAADEIKRKNEGRYTPEEIARLPGTTVAAPDDPSMIPKGSNLITNTATGENLLFNPAKTANPNGAEKYYDAASGTYKWGVKTPEGKIITSSDDVTAAPGKEGPDNKDMPSHAIKIKDQYEKQTAPTMEAAQAYSRVVAAYNISKNEPDNGINDVNLLQASIKVNHPNAVIRENEAHQFYDTTGILGNAELAVLNALNTSGGKMKLTQLQRDQLFEGATSAMHSQLEIQKQNDADTRAFASALGLAPNVTNSIISPRYQKQAMEVQKVVDENSRKIQQKKDPLNESNYTEQELNTVKDTRAGKKTLREIIKAASSVPSQSPTPTPAATPLQGQ